MLNSLQIKFNEYRKFSDLMNVTFTFTRHELKPLFKSLLLMALPLLVLLGIVLGIFHAENMSLVQSDNLGNLENFGIEFLQNMIIQYGLIIIIYYLSITVIGAIVLGYIVEYINNGPQVPFENVLAQVKIYLPRLLALNLVYYLIVGFASIFLFVPGIYLGIAMAISPVVLVFEDTGIGGSLKRSMYLVKGYWWRTLGYLIVIGIVYTLISAVFGLPAGMLSLLQTLGVVTAAPDSPAILMITIIANIISTISYLFSGLVVIFMAFYYYSQFELKEAGNLMKNIENMASEIK
ncbi:MAG: hypothetical protein KIT33_14160 [Candidatus Kapabacteria bacterium]|nr:hypothetical protein [Ignavibacteriota bacterium]MCW5886111.1 hypothetical protein [Candidatus Kapabacteria bacterium]